MTSLIHLNYTAEAHLIVHYPPLIKTAVRAHARFVTNEAQNDPVLSANQHGNGMERNLPEMQFAAVRWDVALETGARVFSSSLRRTQKAKGTLCKTTGLGAFFLPDYFFIGSSASLPRFFVQRKEIATSSLVTHVSPVSWILRQEITNVDARVTRQPVWFHSRNSKKVEDFTESKIQAHESVILHTERRLTWRDKDDSWQEFNTKNRSLRCTKTSPFSILVTASPI